MKRYIIGWQYSLDNKVKTKSLCSELRSKNLLHLLKIFIPYIIFMNIIIYLFNKNISKYTNDEKLNQNIFKITIFTSIISTFLPLYLPSNIGTGMITKYIQFTIYLLICLISSINSPINGLLLYNYIMLTEIFLPSKLVTKSLKKVGH